MHSILPLLALVSLALLPPASHQDPRQCSITRETDTLIFRCGDHVVGRYLINPSQTKPHFHPLYSPDGKRITRAYPMEKDAPDEPAKERDHVHHRGCWVGHQIVLLEKEPGQKPLNVNFWAELVNPAQQQQGKQVCLKAEEPRNGAGQASVVTHNLWQTTGGTKVLEETRTLHLVDLGSAQLIVFDIDLHATEGAITFGDEKDGFFAVRVAVPLAEKTKQGGLLENAEGKRTEGPPENKNRQGCWGLLSDWVDYSGVVEGEKVGITLLDHPRNPVRACWHARAYGLFSANPFGRAKSKFPDRLDSKELVKIPAGEHLRFRYGVLIHPGNVQEGKVAECYKRFTQWKEPGATP